MGDEAVLLLGVDTPIGLSIIRELGSHGVKVYGIGSHALSLGKYSRFIHRWYKREQDEDSLIHQLESLSREFSILSLMAISENDLNLLNRNRERFTVLKVLAPPQEALDRVVNKEITYQFASALGIDVPTTLVPGSISALTERHAEQPIQFPVVMKWSNPQNVSQLAGKLGVSLKKAEYAYNFDELKAALLKYQGMGEYPLVQTYCKGSGIGHFFYVHGGKIIQRFQHVRRHEWPPEGGVSTYCQGVPPNSHVELMKKSERLLLDIGWEGVAMVEYRYDSKTGKAYLMEINGRFWGSLPLAFHSSANFAWLLYNYAGKNRVVKASTPRTDLHCRYMIPETKRLFRLLFQRSKICDQNYIATPARDLANFILQFFNPKMRYYVFSIRDPLPFFSDIYGAILKIVKREAD